MIHIELTKAEYNLAKRALIEYKLALKREKVDKAQKIALAASILIAKLSEAAKNSGRTL